MKTLKTLARFLTYSKAYPKHILSIYFPEGLENTNEGSIFLIYPCTISNIWTTSVETVVFHPVATSYFLAVMIDRLSLMTVMDVGVYVAVF